jgi:hypothetical protein
MRSVRWSWNSGESLLWGTGALAVVLAVAVPAASAAPATLEKSAQAVTPPAETKQAAASTDDYYTRRARTVLEAEKAGDASQHPLAASYPGMEIVVCEAGCTTSRGPQVVFQRSLASISTKTEGTMVLTSGSDRNGPAAGSSKVVACVGGCYDGAGFTAEPAAMSPIGDWSTTVEPDAPRSKLSPIR